MQLSKKDLTRLLRYRKITPGPEPTSCWIWTGSERNAKGYGGINIRRKTYLVHVVSFLFYRGPIPAGLELDHLCHVNRCFNPNHLEPVTHTENILRGRNPNLEKETCLRGHPYHYRFRASTGRLRRDCQTCFNAAQNKKNRESKAKPHD